MKGGERRDNKILYLETHIIWNEGLIMLIKEKELRNEYPMISIITVSYNVEFSIRKTIESVLNQDYFDLEYIIIDGKSKDNTLAIAESYSDLFAEKKIKYLIISEIDLGVYYAMNKGIEYASGEWIIFLNSNDYFYNNDVLKVVFKKKYTNDIGAIYGNTWNEKDNILYHKKASKIDAINYKAPFVHQALFVRKELLKKYRFNTQYKISADYDQFVRLYIDGITFKKIDEDISVFNLDGISQSNIVEVNREWDEIQQKNGIYFNYFFHKKIRRLISQIKKNKYIYHKYIFFMHEISKNIQNIDKQRRR